MKISRRKLILVNCAFLGSTAFGSVGFATWACAQNVAAPALNQSASLTAPTQSAASIAAFTRTVTRSDRPTIFPHCRI
jgi:hypothetical protein